MLIVNYCINNIGVSPDDWFKNVCDWGVIKEEFPRRMLKDISKCEVIDRNVLVSEILGGISPECVGSGCKAVLYMLYGKNEFGPIDLSWCGDNIMPYVREVGKMVDVEVTSERFLKYIDESKGEEVMLKNNGKIYKTNKELFDAMIAEGLDYYEG